MGAVGPSGRTQGLQWGVISRTSVRCTPHSAWPAPLLRRAASGDMYETTPLSTAATDLLTVLFAGSGHSSLS
jgi:hypothetical protein